MSGKGAVRFTAISAAIALSMFLFLLNVMPATAQDSAELTQSAAVTCTGDYVYNLIENGEGLWVTGQGCSSQPKPTDSTSINVPKAGIYDVTGVVKRGNPGQNQTNEDFYLSVGSQTGPETQDDADPWAISTRVDNLGTFSFISGSSTVVMHGAAICPPDTTPNSVELTQLCLNFMACPANTNDEKFTGGGTAGEDWTTDVSKGTFDVCCRLDQCVVDNGLCFDLGQLNAEMKVTCGISEDNTDVEDNPALYRCTWQNDGNIFNPAPNGGIPYCCKNVGTAANPEFKFVGADDPYCNPGPVCGNGIVELGEQCDDGNANNNDLCTNACTKTFCGDSIMQNPNGFGQAEACDDGNVNNADTCSNACTITFCGDGVKQNPNGQGTAEQCDDGNTNNGDGCSSICKIEQQLCGNGILNSGEQCDDGNTNNGDGCSNACLIEGCGDGFVDSNGADNVPGNADDEQCDDGNQNNNDACRNNCRLPICGDGVKDPNEQCDDGNTNNNDACRNNCILPICGDGIKDANEQCDDGNTNNNDACSNVCTTIICENGRFRTAIYSDTNTLANNVQSVATYNQNPAWTAPIPGATWIWSTFLVSNPSVNQTVTFTKAFELPSDATGLMGAIKVATDNNYVCYMNNLQFGADPSTVNYQLGTEDTYNVSSFLQTGQDTLKCQVTNIGIPGSTPQANPAGLLYKLELSGKSPIVCGPFCGDGVKDTNEQCDDGNTRNGDGCSMICKIEVCTPASCLLPNTLGDTTAETILKNPGEQSLQQMLNTAGYAINVTFDQKQYQIWNFSGYKNVSLEIQMVNTSTAHPAVFGYYLNGNLSTFKPLFRLKSLNGSTHPLYPNVTIFMPKNKTNITVASNTNIGFAINSFEPATGISRFYATQNALNHDLADHVVAYDLCTNEYILGFEDLPQGATDIDYQDLIVSIKVLFCTDIQPFCGDGIKQQNEQCDDGNIFSNDGCSNACVIEFCGDNTIQDVCQQDGCNGPGLGEQCDDGNANSGDGCNNVCQLESCGDTIVDSNGIDNVPGNADDEQCDDGNNANGDGCSTACKLEFCGDGIVQDDEYCQNPEHADEDICQGEGNFLDEQCDDGNQNNNDACTNVCTLTFCGDSAIQSPNGFGQNETCDDGNNASGDGCSAICELEFCGDGVQQQDEQCDDGNNFSNDGCSAVCVLEFCGDEIVQDECSEDGCNGPGLGEQCDDGNTANGDGCNSVCQAEFCGDGLLDTNGPDNVLNNTDDEQCDDNNNINGDGCSAICKTEFCGDGIVQTDEYCDDPEHAGSDICVNGTFLNEQCDDGNTQNGDGCNSVCNLEFCGDGVIQSALGEQCDDNNTVSGDGCSSICKLEVCGDGIVQPGEQCDDGNSNNNDTCTNTCTKTFCGDSIKQQPNGVGTGGPQNNGFEACDDGNQQNNDTCTPICTLTFCGDAIIQKPNGVGQNETCDDGNVIDGDGCDQRCQIEPFCGDGHVDPGEQCDDGNNNNGDGCTAQCVLEFCGDGIKQPNEQCDDGNQNNNDLCSNNCTKTFCGDATLQQPNGVGTGGPLNNGFESCDDGNPLNNDTCTQACTLTFCGDTIIQKPNGLNQTEQCDDGNSNDGDGCDHKCRLEICGNGILNPGEQCDDGNANNNDVCNNQCHLTICGDAIIQQPNGFGKIEQCDDGNNVTGDGCSNQCDLEFCGDGVKQPSEQCDDGNTNNGDGCSAICTIEACGNGVVDYGEQCDDGNQNNSDLCTNECTKTFCGDAVIQSPNGFGQNETCDDGNTNSGDGCSSICRLEFCGDNITDSNGPDNMPGNSDDEQCDDGNNANGDGCNSICKLEFCGDNITQPGLGEQCDDGNHVNEDGCNAQCRAEFCGDGILQPGLGEQCDDSNNINGDGCSAICKLEVCEDNITPITIKTYGTPFYTNGTSEWINTSTLITLNTTDQIVCKNLTTFYRVKLVPDIYCFNQDLCQTLNGTGNYTKYTTPFRINEQSCHLVEFFATDGTNNETVKKQCPFVDSTPPVGNKTVGEPKEKWAGDNTFYPNLTQRCWANNSNSIECWKVTTLTPLTLSCSDPNPHPVDHSRVCFNVELDGDDATQDYCEAYDGEMNGGYCCKLIENSTLDFYFLEESQHNLKFYCEDALGNKGAIDDEKFKVEGRKFIIHLNKKWNLISVPFPVLNSSLNAIFDDIAEDIEAVWTYDATTGQWHVFTPDGIANDDITEMMPGWGYWVLANNATNITIGGTLFSPITTPPVKNLTAGWNLIGYYGISNATNGTIFVYDGPDGEGKKATCALGTLVDTVIGYPKWTSLVTYWEPFNVPPTPNPWVELNFTEHMDPGAGYWLFINENALYASSTTCPFIV